MWLLGGKITHTVCICGSHYTFTSCVCGQRGVEDVLTEKGLAVVSRGDAATLKSAECFGFAGT